MKLSFNIDYRTRWGETLHITGNLPELGEDNPEKARAMTLSGDSTWRLDTEITPAQAGKITYRYFVRRDDGSLRTEWGDSHRCSIDAHTPSACLYDHWQDMPDDKPFHSSVFANCIFRQAGNDPTPPSLRPGTITLEIDAPEIPAGDILAISGASEALGRWNPAKAVALTPRKFPQWSVTLPAEAFADGCEYKFLILDKQTHEVVAWERSGNRKTDIKHDNANTAYSISGLHFDNPMAPWRGAGVAIPVFSLRSETDFGVGDFLDLKLMIDWAASTGQNFVQLLPVNDTTMTGTWTDSYPYNAISTFALHPMYLNLKELGTLADPKEQERFDVIARELNQLPDVDYERANRTKEEWTRLFFDQQGERTLQSDEFKNFISSNRHWLLPYAAFCVLRDRYGTPDMRHWEEYAEYRVSLIDRLTKTCRKEIEYVYFVQYHLDRQLRHVRDYAHSRGVVLKGDIPIGISRNSVDAWVNPELFNLDCSAGAPPDDFSIMGQNWGFPTYNWEVMSRDGFAWWKSRFRKMAEYFDAYRIDHVLGFFRIWQIPLDALHGLLGVFNAALPFTPDELRYNYDFHLDPERHTQPFITDGVLHETFGELTEEVRATYLEPTDDGRYRLRGDMTTQRAIADRFAAMDHTDRNTRVCEGLLKLIDNVLFIEDPYKAGTYHPRIAAQRNSAYRALNDYERWRFDTLYNDFFYRRHNEFWREKAMWKLPPLIDATGMLVCAEDLGMIPACVPSVMNELEILSLEIQRMPKDPSVEWADTWHYPYLSVCTTSTHDMGGIRQWWEQDRQSTQRFYNQVLGQQGEAPYFAEPYICTSIVKMHLQSPSMLCILPLQDWMSTDGRLRRQDPREEQINVPANPRHYWRYRMHLTLENLLHSDDFNRSIAMMVAESGR